MKVETNITIRSVLFLVVISIVLCTFHHLFGAVDHQISSLSESSPPPSAAAAATASWRSGDGRACAATGATMGASANSEALVTAAAAVDVDSEGDGNDDDAAAGGGDGANANEGESPFGSRRVNISRRWRVTIRERRKRRKTRRGVKRHYCKTYLTLKRKMCCTCCSSMFRLIVDSSSSEKHSVNQRTENQRVSIVAKKSIQQRIIKSNDTNAKRAAHQRRADS